MRLLSGRLVGGGKSDLLIVNSSPMTVQGGGGSDFVPFVNYTD